MKKLSITFTAVLVLLFVMPYFQTQGHAGSTTLNYANFPPAPTFPCVQMEQWKKEVEKRTDNQLKINTFPGGTLLGAKAMMDGVIAGQADIGCLCMAYQPGRFTVTNAVSLPLGISDSKTGSLVLFDLYNRYQPASFDKVKVLTLFTTAPANIMSKTPVRTLTDIKGLDLRASGGAAEILKRWGANQIGMPMSATPEALQKGVVQGLFSSLEVMKDLKFAEDCKYVTMTDTVVYPFAVVMNMKKWNGLSNEVQQVLNDLSREQAEWTGVYMDSHVNDSIEWSKAQGVEFITLDEKEWNTPLSPIVHDWIEKADQKGFNGEEIVKNISSLIEKNSK
ncbi:MAG: TRAP transporter substrate-binding protein [Thermodesulfobacteriota bacterium]|nr:TRAP transporter substrate-binding protein [Thermodesulfobacteriota bacterium]